jgi:hypothetical protein
MLACVVLTSGRSSFAQVGPYPYPTNLNIPFVTVKATVPVATWSGSPGVFTVARTGNPAPALNVFYQISGTASNGVDYQSIGNWVTIPSGVLSRDVVITPIKLGQSVTKTVVLTLTNSPLMGPVGGSMPVNYIIGWPSSATVFITSGPVTNIPPMVSVASPADGDIFYAPVNIPIVACAQDLDGFVRSVEFFADNVSLGIVTSPVSILPPISGPVPTPLPMPPYRPFVLVWSNAPVGPHALTAKATDNGGASTLSAPVNIAVKLGPPPPPTNVPPIVRITSPADNAVFRAPVNIPIFAFAADVGGYVTNVEFYAGMNALGPGHQVNVVPPPLPPGPIRPPILIIRPTNYWALVWSNALQGNYPLIAVATDNRGTSAVSGLVNITILPPLPPPTLTNVVSILATDPVAIEGTNCWPWFGLAGAAPTWTNWTGPTAVWRYFTNCGPKDAVFTVRRLGQTNADLVVPYTIGGTATNGVEYVTLPGTVTIPAGQRAAMITVVPIDDGQPDMTSTVILKLAPPANYLVDPQHGTAAAIILDRPTRPPLTGVLPDGCFHINSPGPDGAWVHVEYTTDLSNWTPVCTNQVVNGSIDFVDPDAQGNPLRFYRTVPEANPPQ